MQIGEGFQQFLEYLRIEKHFSNYTFRSYRSDLIQFIDFLETECSVFDIENVNFGHIRTFVGSLIRGGFKKSSAERKLAAIKSFFSFLTKRSYIKNNPAKLVKSPRKQKKVPSFLSQSDPEGLMDLPVILELMISYSQS